MLRPFVADPKDDSLKRMIASLCHYGANLNEANSLSLLRAPLWWRNFGGKSAENILRPYLESRDLAEHHLILGTLNCSTFLRDSDIAINGESTKSRSTVNRNGFFTAIVQNNEQLEGKSIGIYCS